MWAGRGSGQKQGRTVRQARCDIPRKDLPASTGRAVHVRLRPVNHRHPQTSMVRYLRR
jgi:hypothetical protein